MIYQERQLASFLSIAENIFIGNMPKKGILIDFGELNRKAKAIIEEFGLSVSPAERVKDISVAYQQMVEIMKAYSRNADIICFDEPTAPLTDAEIPILFRIIRKLKKMNKVIIYVSHRMNELFQIADRVIVFKDGKFVADKKMTETDEPELIRLMVGRSGRCVSKSEKKQKTGRGRTGDEPGHDRPDQGSQPAGTCRGDSWSVRTCRCGQDRNGEGCLWCRSDGKRGDVFRRTGIQAQKPKGCHGSWDCFVPGGPEAGRTCADSKRQRKHRRQYSEPADQGRICG